MKDIDIQFVRSFGNLELIAKQAIEGFMTGLHKSPFHGFSVEFAEHKQYNTGESTRHIDWKVFAKTDRLYTKFFEEETNLRCQFLLDVSSSMYYPKENFGKVTYAAYACAALAYLLNKQRDALGLILFNDKIVEETPIKGTKSHLQNIFNLLNKTIHSQKVEKATAIPEVLHAIADRKYRRNLIVIFSDFLSNQNDLPKLFSSLQHLKHSLHEILVFHVYDEKTEVNLELENKPHKLIDLETKEKIDLTPEQIQESYKKNMESYFNEIRLLCGKYKIDFVKIDINKPLDDVLMAYLATRARIR